MNTQNFQRLEREEPNLWTGMCSENRRWTY
jgi:hypothetical protein